MSTKAGDEHMGKYVYCKQHLRVHSTGWCTVGTYDKVSLQGDSEKEAAAHAESLGLRPYWEPKDK